MPFTFDFIKVKSYKGLNSVGSVQITGGDLAALEGKNVLVVEDIIDTGRELAPLDGILLYRRRGCVRQARAQERICCQAWPQSVNLRPSPLLKPQGRSRLERTPVEFSTNSD